MVSYIKVLKETYCKNVIETNKWTPNESLNIKIEDVADSVWLCLLMDGNGKRKLPSTSPNTHLSKIKYLNRIVDNLEF